ncbi:MAG: glycosyltransferase family 4 protein [Kofleriaceae bacterium]
MRSEATSESWTPSALKRVLIVETQLKHYRKSFLIDLAARLRRDGVELQVAYSPPHGAARALQDTVELDGDLGVSVPVRFLFGGSVVVQSIWPQVRAADLVIVEQGNKLAFNYVLLTLSKLGLKRVAYWGHGFNHQQSNPGISDWLKRKLLTRVDWWFAYTSEVTRYLVHHGVPADTISTVHNTVDVADLTADVAPNARAALRDALGISASSPVGLYCGALVPEKQLGFLVDAAAEVRRLLPNFELIIVGDGAERSMLDAIAGVRPFIHVVGPALGVARAPYFAIADICMIPARVGLAIVDAFASGIPLATTNHPGHGPELEYLSPDLDGLKTEFDVDSYAAEVARLLGDRPRLDAMRRAASAAATPLTKQRMVEEFATGIIRCLGRP